MAIDTFNRFVVGVNGNEIVLLNPPRNGRMSKADALVLAAWLVALADPGTEHPEFERVLAAVCGT